MDLAKMLRDKKIIAVARGFQNDQLLNIADALIKGGISFMEIPFGRFDDRDTAEKIRLVNQHFSEKLFVGAGTVLTKNQVTLAAKAGAKYIVSPNFDKKVIRAAKRGGLLSIAGAFSPSEIIAAYSAGADVIKVFPADVLTPRFFAAVKTPLADLPLLAVGGITADNIKQYLDAGACGAAVSSYLLPKDEIEKGNYSAVTDAACRLNKIIGL